MKNVQILDFSVTCVTVHRYNPKPPQMTVISNFTLCFVLEFLKYVRKDECMSIEAVMAYKSEQIEQKVDIIIVITVQ